MAWRGRYVAAVDLYCKRKSDNTWVKVGTAYLEGTATASRPTGLPSTVDVSGFENVSVSFSIEQATSGNEFGIHSADGTILTFGAVKYNTASSVTETAVTQLIGFSIEAPIT